MPQQNLKVRSGNRLTILFDGKQLGLLQNVSMQDDYGLDAASGIGDAKVVEHVPGLARHTLNVSQMLLSKQAMLEAGIAMENSDAVLQGMVFDIAVYDKDTGVELRKYLGCSYASGGIEVSKHAIVVTSGVFMALDVIGLGA